LPIDTAGAISRYIVIPAYTKKAAHFNAISLAWIWSNFNAFQLDISFDEAVLKGGGDWDCAAGFLSDAVPQCRCPTEFMKHNTISCSAGYNI
jgi:hypothetical protein